MTKKIKYLLSIFVAVLSMPLLADVEYNIIPLEPADYIPSSLSVESEVYDLSETGYVVGSISCYPHFPLTKGFVYHPDEGFKVILGPLENGDLKAEKINNEGVVVGWINKKEWRIQDDGHGASCGFDTGIFIFDQKDNLFIDPPSLSKIDTFDVLGISNNGKILVRGDWNDLGMMGYIYDRSMDEVSFSTPPNPIAINNAGNIIGNNWYYSIEGGLKNLPSLDPYDRWDVNAEVLSENNVVAGVGADIQENEKGFIWDEENGMRVIYTLGGDRIKIKGINNLSQVVGSSKTEDLITHAFIFDESLGTMDLGTLGGEKSSASDINDLTQVVGYAESYSKVKDKRAFIWDKVKGMRDLNDLIPNNSGWKKLEEAKKINNKGYIIGQGIYQGQERGFLLIPKHENLK